MSFELEQKLRAELGRDERLLWSGVPAQGLRLQASDAIAIPFSLLWGGFAIFWESSVIASNAPFFFRLWGIPFVLVGLYITVGRFFADSYLRSRTSYGVSNQRVIILSGVFSREVKSLTLASLGEIAFKERADGSGSITFGAASPFYPTWARGAWPGMRNQAAPSFEGVAEVRKVYNVIREAQRNLAPPASAMSR